MKRGRPLTRKTWFRSSKPLPRTAIPAQRKPLRAVSLKRQKENRVRRQVLEQMCSDGQPVCFVGCGRLADDGHELLSRGRGGSITDPVNIRPVCRLCHTEITENPAWAESMGYALPTPERNQP